MNHYNTMNHDKYHHVIQYATPGEAKSIKICRCWQSKRFPYCDDTHKVMIEAGDNIGPYVVKINPGKGSARPGANITIFCALDVRRQFRSVCSVTLSLGMLQPITCRQGVRCLAKQRASRLASAALAWLAQQASPTPEASGFTWRLALVVGASLPNLLQASLCVVERRRYCFHLGQRPKASVKGDGKGKVPGITESAWRTGMAILDFRWGYAWVLIFWKLVDIQPFAHSFSGKAELRDYPMMELLDFFEHAQISPEVASAGEDKRYVSVAVVAAFFCVLSAAHLALGASLQCRDFEGYCVIGARGEAASANALRSLARASELGKSPIEFRARWHEDPGDERSLRFYAEICETWSDFKKRWKAIDGTPRVLPVTPHTSVHQLATAVATDQRKVGGVALKLNHKNATVMAIAAKVLATLPHLAQNEEIGCGLVCVLRWPMIEKPEAAKFVYAHVSWRKPEVEKGEKGHDEAGRQVADQKMLNEE
ncbi:unnamed protein product [Polarella glacialis]|uniref:Iron-binding zinc finger CDGSH type domain-containing protein n=1 Tax=Polarella glacialis TaxID=89957 RepID=A0A813H8A4_POLGL|nr:unnamed protein product [Polarella glacialis]